MMRQDLAAEPDHLLALPQPEPVRPIDDLLIGLVGGPQRDLSDLPLADAPAALADGVADHLHDALIVGRGRGKTFSVAFSVLYCRNSQSMVP
jgi:hypothetical protein